MDAAADRAIELHREIFGREAEAVARAPGRANLIGEHTDYNDGFVLPFGTDLACYVAFSRRDDAALRVYSEAFGEAGQVELNSLEPRRHWLDYPAGVAWSLQREGVEVPGMDAAVVSTVPPGGGLSSSAAIEVAFAVAFLHLAGAEVAPVRLALACQRAENEFVGMKCGIMDQLTSVLAARDSAILLDCWTLDHELVPLDSDQVAVMVMDTGKPRELVESEYNQRREQCEAAARALGIRALRDAEMEELEQALAEGRIDEVTFRRARHVVSENDRVIAMADALRAGNYEAAGELINQSHFSLRDDYEVSCAELDLICEIAREREECYGARLVGAGFGGCAIALIRAGWEEEFAEAVKGEYDARSGRQSRIFPVRAAEGAGIIWER